MEKIIDILIEHGIEYKLENDAIKCFCYQDGMIDYDIIQFLSNGSYSIRTPEGETFTDIWDWLGYDY